MEVARGEREEAGDEEGRKKTLINLQEMELALGSIAAEF